MAWHPFRNLGMKIVALALSTFMWIAVSGQQAERRVRVPLEFRKVPTSLEITGAPPDAVEVRIRGASSQLSRLELGDIIAFIDLTDAGPGQSVFSLQTDHVIAPLGVEVTRVDPPELTLTLEPTGTAVVPVVPTIAGRPAAGYVIADTDGVSVDPQTVEVVGPEDRLHQLRSAVTERISVDGKQATFTEIVRIGVSDATLRLREPQTARVTIKIVPVRGPGPRLQQP
jgi:YbbR domain-containing protein